MDETPEKRDYTALKEYGGKILARIKDAEKREETWIKNAEAAEKAYTVDSSGDFSHGKLYDFNILHSNVETIVPAIYNSTPQPDIRPRRVESMGPAPQPPQVQEGQQPDPGAVQAFRQQMLEYQARKQRDKDARDYANMLERAIAVQIDDNRLDTEVESIAQDAFLAGRGILRLRFEGVYGESEKITFEAVSWRDYRCGPAKRWGDLPWEAYRVVVSEETYKRITDNNDEMISGQLSEGETAVPSGDKDEDDIEIWEVWDAVKQKVCLVRDSDGLVLSEMDDPLGLPGFYPRPTPVQPITVTGRIMPVTPFSVYQKLADELDRITKRINKIMSGLKVRGVVAGNASTLANLQTAEDNEIRIENDLEGLMQTGGLETAVLWWPVEQGIKVLIELYKQRDAVKAAIYEITGISDIVRGASQASETATAQQIKTQWGSLRIQRMQRMVERMVRDTFVLMAHIITTKFSKETLTRMTGIEMSEGIQQLMQNPVDADYRINVESDSTVRADLTQKKQEMAEFLQGSAQYFQMAGRVIAEEPSAAEPLAELYASTTRLFNLGKQAEDAMERFTTLAKESASKPRPNPEQQKMEMEAKAQQTEMQMRQQETQAQLQQDAQKSAADIEIKKIELAIKQAELAIKERELRLKEIESQITRELEAQRIEDERERNDREHGLRVVEGDRKERMEREKANARPD